MAIYVAVHISLRPMVEDTDFRSTDRMHIVDDNVFCFKGKVGGEVIEKLRALGITCNIVGTGSGKQTLGGFTVSDDSFVTEMWRKALRFDHQGKEVPYTWYPDRTAELLEMNRLLGRHNLDLDSPERFGWGTCLCGPVLLPQDLINAKKHQTWKLLTG